MSLIALPAFLIRRREDTTMPDTAATPEAPAPADDNTVARFLTLGGAVVRMYPTRFITRWAGGPPFAADPHEIGGFQWECVGCGAYGREGETYKDRNYREQAEARTEANEHADTCRAMPSPEA